MIDIHSHIIPGIDDGAKDEEMSIEMLKLAESSGTKQIIATPHYMRGRFNYEYNEVLEEVNKLKQLANDNNIDLEIYPGQEVYYSTEIPRYFEEGIIGTLNQTKYMLIELPMLEFDLDEVINTIYELRIRKIQPIIAHPERYKPFIKTPSMINALIEEGYLFQLNAGSLTGEFGKEVKKTAEIYLEHSIYNFAGSDGHRSGRRNTDVRDFLDIIDEHNLEIIRESSEALINNKDVYFDGRKVKGRKKFLGIF